MRRFIKKIIGSIAVLATFIGTTIAFTPPEALAAFVATTVGVIADGVVTSVNGSTFVMQTSGGELKTVKTDSQTVILKGPIEVGQQVGIIAHKVNGKLHAQIVRVKSSVSSGGGGGSSYGTSGPAISVRATVVSKSGTSLVVKTGAGTVTYKVTASTKFVGDTFSGISTGDRLIITGKDTGTAFIATVVVVQ